MAHRPLKTIAILVLIACAGVEKASAQGRAVTEDHRHYPKFHSKFLPKDREVVVWLPPRYKSETKRRYPVLYMHDGMAAFVHWRLDETAAALIANNQLDDLLIVFVDNGGTSGDRFNEYTPTHDAAYARSGNANNYGRMLVEELKPFIDAEYRTLTGPENTALGGASLGGLVTAYLGFKYPGTFGLLAIMSPSVWWDKGMIFRKVKSLSAKSGLRIWLDVGTAEGEAVKQTRLFRDALKTKGWAQDSDLNFFEAKDAKHDDQAFGRRASLFLKFLFPKRDR